MMKRWFMRVALLLVCLAVLPVKTPAPLVYRPGEGWSWEPVGGAKWIRQRAKDQLEVAQQNFDAKNYSVARAAARRVVRNWPLSDYAPQAQFLVARCLEERGDAELAFNEYQKLLTKYPKIDIYDDVLARQEAIADKYFAGKHYYFWHVIPYRSTSQTAGLYDKVVKNGPYSKIGPVAQMQEGATYEKGKKFPLAVKAYERAADRYHYMREVASDALFKAGVAYTKQAKTAEYDQSIAGKAIAAFTDFMTLYPDDPRVPEAQKTITSLKTEQARGSFMIARYYEKKNRLDGALIYYSESATKDPNSKFAEEARQKIEQIKARQLAKAASGR